MTLHFPYLGGFGGNIKKEIDMDINNPSIANPTIFFAQNGK